MKYATRGNRLRNYIVPGLDSTLISKVRMFEMKREQDMLITPHSHRFDLSCYVLEGRVVNTTYEMVQGSAPYGGPDLRGNSYGRSILSYNGQPGHYEKALDGVYRYYKTPKTYEKGDWYDMTHNTVHSITFEKGARVLIFEGPDVSKETVVLEPCDHNDQIIPTFKVEEWMFRHV
jgi:hypothetical protein